MNEALIPIRLTLAAAVVFFLPGWALLRLWDERPPWGERFPLAVGLSISLVTLLTVVWVEARLQLSTMPVLLMVVILLGMVRRPGPSVPESDGAPSYFPALCAGFLGLLFTAGLFYRIGGTLQATPTGEEVLHLSIIRKLWGLSTLAPDNLMYMKETATTYVYPPYHAMVALVAQIAAVDPLVAFVRLRGAMTFMAVGTMAGLVQLSTRSRGGGVIGLYVSLALLWWNVAGQVLLNGQPLYWAPLAPLAHLGDFGLGIVLPLCVFFVLRYLQDDRLISRRLSMALVMAGAAIVIHVREALQVLLYLGCFATVLALRRQHRKLAQAALLIVGIIALGLVYKQRHDALVGHIAMHETANHQIVLDTFGQLVAQPFGGLFADPAYFRSETLLFGILPAVFLIMAPVLLALSSDVALMFACSSIVGFLLIFRIPALAWLYVRFTYSEVLMTPLRNVDLLCMLLVGVAVCSAVSSLPKLERLNVPPWFATVWITAASVAVWAGLGRLLSGLAGAWQDGFFLLFVASLACALALAVWGPPDWRLRFSDAPVVLGRKSVPLLLGSLCALGYAGRPPSLFAQVEAAGARPAVEAEESWYPSTNLSQKLDYRMLKSIRRLPETAVVMTEPDLALELTMLANVYVPTSGAGFSSDVVGFVEILRCVRGDSKDFGREAWRAYLARSAYYHEVLAKEPPVFSPSYSAAQQMTFLTLLRADYLLFQTESSPHLEQLAEDRPHQFALVESVGSQRLYRISGLGPPTECAPPTPT